ncbi:MAG: hypothetical protein IPJ65_42550 [Archangiaceae bacterium]|nr:hypothetical protein [Archangiaceae bacterium]
MNLRKLLLLAAVSAVTACSGGGAAVCSSDVDLSGKTGTCSGVPSGRVLGEASTCSTRVSSCSASDTTAVKTALECFGKLPTCAAATQADWVSQYTGCGSGLSALSQACKDSLFGGVVPGGDGGTDGGSVDAGRQPIDDGGHGISMVAVADESRVAFAWVPRQPAPIETWELNVFDTTDGGATRLPEVDIPGGTTRTYELSLQSGLGRRYYLAGIDQMNQLAFGFIEDAGAMVVDAGCTQHAQCATTQVCDLGTCMQQTCQMNATCPQPDYVCDLGVTPHTCLRTGNSMMGIDAGMMMAIDLRLPMISPSQNVRAGPPSYSETFIGGFQARRPDMVAIDSARQFVAMEQGGEPVGHFTVSRGKDFVLDTQSASVIDTVGTNVKVAYNADSRVIYACYTVGRGVRVRRSRDFGKTWGTGALTLDPEDDGGTDSTIKDCDIAAWKNGTALVVTVEDDHLVTRQVNEILSVNGNPDLAFVSSPTDGGGYNVYQPRRPAIATLPEADLVHIGFTATRVNGGLPDPDIFGVYRDNTSGGTFSNPQFINTTGVSSGSAFPQDAVALTIDPVTRRAVAAWTTLENTGSATYSTVYVGFFNNSTKKWITGSDLSVYMQFGGNYPLFPQRTTGTWDAFAAQVAALRDGRVWVMVLGGERGATANDIYPYAVEFAFDAGSPVGGTGWFKPPAVKMSNTKSVDPRGGGNSVPLTNAAFAADSQISIYGAFIEGLGPTSSEENRGVFVTRP